MAGLVSGFWPEEKVTCRSWLEPLISDNGRGFQIAVFPLSLQIFFAQVTPSELPSWMFWLFFPAQGSFHFLLQKRCMDRRTDAQVVGMTY